MQHNKIQAALLTEQRGKDEASEQLCEAHKQLLAAQTEAAEATNQHKVAQRELQDALNQVSQLLGEKAQLKDDMEQQKVQQCNLWATSITVTLLCQHNLC